MNAERRCKGVTGMGVRGLVGEAHSSSHYGRWLLRYFRLSISGGTGGWGEIPKGGPVLGCLTHTPPPGCSHSASPLTAHLVTTITPPSSSPPSPRLPLYLPPLLHLPSLSNSPSLTLSGTHITHTTHTTHTILPLDSQYVPHSLPFLHFSWEAAPDSQMSLACQKLLLTFQFSGVFFSYCSLLMPYSRRTFTCQWARQKKGGRVCLLPF